ncbi:hypothetical protein BJ917_2888 [Pseudomonas sp. WPR_5_2]|nr:hypothetical protein BJ917_2888 [Pseudomonas sp. WPR_5_2]
MDVNDDEGSQDERGGALTFIASKLAPTQSKKKPPVSVAFLHLFDDQS